MRLLGALALTAVLTASMACGGPSAQGPLTVNAGIAREQLAGELRRFEYCQADDPPAAIEVFPRCRVPGVEFGQSWVVAHYASGRAVRLQRWERYPEDARGLTRFNELVEKRTALVPPDEEAKRQIAGQQDLPMGTRTWVAFRVSEHTLVGVYLLEPSPPEYATVLEEIIELRLDIDPKKKAERGCTDCAPIDR